MKEVLLVFVGLIFIYSFAFVDKVAYDYKTMPAKEAIRDAEAFFHLATVTIILLPAPGLNIVKFFLTLFVVLNLFDFLVSWYTTDQVDQKYSVYDRFIFINYVVLIFLADYVKYLKEAPWVQQLWRGEILGATQEQMYIYVGLVGFIYLVYVLSVVAKERFLPLRRLVFYYLTGEARHTKKKRKRMIPGYYGQKK